MVPCLKLTSCKLSPIFGLKRKHCSFITNTISYCDHFVTSGLKYVLLSSSLFVTSFCWFESSSYSLEHEKIGANYSLQCIIVCRVYKGNRYFDLLPDDSEWVYPNLLSPFYGLKRIRDDRCKLLLFNVLLLEQHCLLAFSISSRILSGQSTLKLAQTTSSSILHLIEMTLSFG